MKYKDLSKNHQTFLMMHAILVFKYQDILNKAEGLPKGFHDRLFATAAEGALSLDASEREQLIKLLENGVEGLAKDIAAHNKPKGFGNLF